MRIVVTVRGRLRAGSEEELRAAHDALLAKLREGAAASGNLGHRAYRSSPHGRELMVVDTWTSLDGARGVMSDPNLPAGLATFFDGMPEVVTWVDSGWDGYDPPGER